MILSKVCQTIEKYRMIEKGDSVLVAFSGGPDSVALLHILFRLREEYSLSLQVAHLNHQLRGEESELDVQFVKEFVRKLDLPLHIESKDVAKFAQEKGLSLEEGAREFRYQFLDRVASQIGIKRIATGHTKTDQAETVLLRLLRGAGWKGLCGIPPVRDSKIIRPLIEVERREIEEYLGEEKLSFRFDSSNILKNHLRNRIRLRLIPLLQKEYSPKIVEILARTAALIEEDEKFLSEEVGKILPGLLEKRKEEIVLDFKKILKYNKSLQRRILREAIYFLKGNLKGVEFQHIEALLKLMEWGGTGKSLTLPSGLRAEIGYKELFLKYQDSSEFKRIDLNLTLGIGERREIPELGLTVEMRLLSPSELPSEFKGKDSAYFDMDKINPPFTLRFRRPGDRFQPLGMKSEKKLKEIFIDDKIPRSLRNQIPLLLDREGILWIVGFKRAERAKIEPQTKRVLLVAVEGLGR